MPSRPWNSTKAAIYAVFAILAVMTVFQIVARRGLYADASTTLLWILEQETFFTRNDKARLFAFWFTQFPLVLAVKTGVRNLPFLTYLFPAWLTLTPILWWSAALWKLKSHRLFWPFVGLFTLVYFNCAFFLIGEYNLSYALSAFCLALLLRNREFSRGDYVALLGAAILSVMSYASTLLMGPLLAFAALRHWKKETDPKLRRYWTILIGVFVLSALVGLWGTLFPGMPVSRKTAMNTLVVQLDWRLWLSLACICLFLLLFFIDDEIVRKRLYRVLLGVAIFALTAPFQPAPNMYYWARAYVGVFLLVGSAFFVWMETGAPTAFITIRLKNFPARYGIIGVFVLFAELSFMDIKSSIAFNRYVHDFSERVNDNSGFIPHEVFAATVSHDELYGWLWGYPAMSQILRKDKTKAIILNPAYGVPIQPYDPQFFQPDIDRYY